MRYFKQNPGLFIIAFFLCVAGCTKPVENMRAASAELNLSSEAATADRPNIILILADDVGYEVPTYTGGQSYSTPTLDRLAANGTRFTQVHAAPLCSPSRFMLMTGKYNFRNYFSWGELGLDQRTLANLAKSGGYKTCVSGKWQFNGGADAIHNFGFDRLCVNEAFKATTGEEESNDFYKDPTVYKDGAYLPASEMKGKYGPDIFRDYMFNFIDSNKTNSFFIYWAMNLCHKPFCPTPDDPAFATWVSGQKPKPKDTMYFRSMVKYMDKQIGQLVLKLQQMHLDQNTIILFAGDNGTPSDIRSKWNGKIIPGGKSQTVEKGYHVPMLAYEPGTVIGGRIDSSLIDFTDFMPTFTKIFQTPLPVDYGIIDGVSFYKQLGGAFNSASRQWVFCHYQPHPDDLSSDVPLRRWMQNGVYKEYDTTSNYTKSGKFYNIVLDPNETKPIPPANRTPNEKNVYNNFRQTMHSLH